MNRHKSKPPEPNPLSGELSPPPERQFYTVAFLSQMLQQPPSFIHQLMDECKVTFAYSENDCGYIAGNDVQKMAATVRDARSNIEGTLRNYANN